MLFAALCLSIASAAETNPPRVSSAQLPEALEGVGIDQRLNELLPLDLGEDFEVVTVSFDPGETPELAVEKKREYTSQYGRDGSDEAWHFLTGSEESIGSLAEAVGFRYRYDPVTDLYRHASAIFVATPEGRVSKYFYGIEYSARDLRLGLVEASAGKIGTAVDEILLFCFHYDPETGKYGVVIMNVLRLAGVATVILLGGFIVLMLRRDRRRKFMLLGTRRASG
jgi:protein SCO1/2